MPRFHAPTASIRFLHHLQVVSSTGVTADEVLEDLVTEAREPVGGNSSEGAVRGQPSGGSWLYPNSNQQQWSRVWLRIEFPYHVIELLPGVMDVEWHQTCGIQLVPSIWV